MPALATERAWCREALLRVSRTFALNIRCLSGRMLESVRLAYLLCRAADALEDSWPGPASEIGARFDTLVAALEGDGAAATRLSIGATSLNGRSDVALLVRLPALLHLLTALDGNDATDIRRCVRTMAMMPGFVNEVLISERERILGGVSSLDMKKFNLRFGVQSSPAEASG